MQVSLLITWALLVRRISLPPAAHVWIAAQCLICCTQALLRCRGARHTCHEAAALAFRLNSCGLGCMPIVLKLWLDQAAVAAGRLALLHHAVLLLFSSGAAVLLLVHANVLRLRCAGLGSWPPATARPCWAPLNAALGVRLTQLHSAMHLPCSLVLPAQLLIVLRRCGAMLGWAGAGI